jgi:flavodoxin
MTVLVAYESSRGRAGEAARAIADAVAVHGTASLVLSIEDIRPSYVDDVGLLIAGCWTPGRVPFGDRPTRLMVKWIEGLRELPGKPIGLFCTYRFFPRTFADTATRTAETLNEMGDSFTSIGARVLATRSINVGSLDKGAANLVTRVFSEAVRS